MALVCARYKQGKVILIENFEKKMGLYSLQKVESNTCSKVTESFTLATSAKLTYTVNCSAFFALV